MKTHELGRALRDLSSILLSGPNVPLNQAYITSDRDEQVHTPNLELSLTALAALSRVGKRQWAELIINLDFPIEIRPRDASRDILGKLLRFLDREPTAREYLYERAKKREVHASPELMRALEALLRQ